MKTMIIARGIGHVNGNVNKSDLSVQNDIALNERCVSEVNKPTCRHWARER
jgi:hypothetical protein